MPAFKAAESPKSHARSRELAREGERCGWRFSEQPLWARRRLPVRGHLRKIQERLTFVALHRMLRLCIEVRAGFRGKRNFRKGRALVKGPFDKFGETDFRGIGVVVITSRKHLPHVPEPVVPLENRTQEIHSKLHHSRSKRFQVLHE